MLKYTSLFLAVLLLFSCATAEHSIITIGTFTLQTDNTWHIDANTAYQVNVSSQSRVITCNMQFYDYGSFSQSHDELIATGLKNDYAIAELIIDSIDSSGVLFETMSKEYYSYNCGISAISYYGNLTEKSRGNYYSGTLLVNSDCILSILTISNTESTDLDEIHSFNDSIVLALSYNGTAITSQSSDSAMQNIHIATQYADGEIAPTGSITFITPDGWKLISYNDIQAIYSIGDTSVCLNAYAPGSLISGMDSMDTSELTECLISVIDSAMVHTGIDTSEFVYLPASLANGNPIVFFEGWAGEALNCQYLTSAIFYTSNGMTGLVTIVTPENNSTINTELLVQSVNMYYASNVLDSSAVPNTNPVSIYLSDELNEIANQAFNGTPVLFESVTDTDDEFGSTAITGINSPVAMVINESGTSINSEESDALTAAIYYTSSGSYTYNSLVQLLVDEGFSYDAAVFAADNCGADWLIE